MKRKISSIFLLLTFLIVVGHGMIPHHHHNNQEFSFLSLKSKKVKHTHHHHDGHTHKHHHENQPQENESSDDEKHEHSFPEHFHISGTGDYVRVTITERTIEVKDISVILPTYNIQKELYKPPERGLKWLISFITDIKPSYQPGANAMRAPPSIA